MTSLGEAYPIKQARCRELLAAYKLLGGAFGAAYIENVLSDADTAAIGGEPLAMLIAYEKMKACYITLASSLESGTK